YYVLGGMSLKCFPKIPADMPAICQNKSDVSTAFNWKNIPPSGGAGSGFPGVPMVCLTLSRSSNACQLDRPVPVVHKPSCSPLEPTCQSLQAAASGISTIQQKSCENNSLLNQEVIANWLFATNFDVTLRRNANVQGLINDDIGLLTEENLIHERIVNVK